jgi:hypothetical protein
VDAALDDVFLHEQVPHPPANPLLGLVGSCAHPVIPYVAIKAIMRSETS